jgi:uncharacterized membrane protein YgdD (TMEM256/DUF423 family)
LSNNISILVRIYGLLGVLLGAFGAHIIRDKVSIESYQSYHTAVEYLFIHVLVLLIIEQMQETKLISYCKIFFSIGIFLFSGSIFLLSTRLLHGMNVNILGPLTPIGGLFLILGWFGLIIDRSNN